VARQRVRANGIELAYDAIGGAGAPPAVLLHALGEAAEDWSDLAPRLVAAGLRVLAFDLRGHADSAWAGSYSSRVRADDVAAALDVLGVRGTVVVARSGVTDAAAWEALGAITAPTLLVAGGPSSHVPQERLDEVAARIPDCTMVTIGGGHHVHRAEPEAFARTVLGWLGAHA